MRTLFWILLLGNVILFAVMQRGGIGWGEQPYQPQPALHEEKIRLLDATQSSPAKVLPESVPAASPVFTPDLVAASAPVVNPAPADSVQNSMVCLEWGEFSGDDLKRATEVLSVFQFGEKLNQRQVGYNKGFWVYIPPLKNKTAASKKVSQIKALGVREYFIVQDAGAFRNAISLGVFKAHDAAQNYLNELHAKGVLSARIGERASKFKTTIFILNNVDASNEVKLNELGKDFAGSELKNVPCSLTR